MSKEIFNRLALYDAVILNDDITPQTALGVVAGIEQKAIDGDKIIDLVVSSRGGDLDETLILLQDLDRLRNTYGCRIKTIARGYAESAATLLVAMGDHRVAYEDTEFLIHEPILTTTGPGEETLTEARREVYETRVAQRKMRKLFAKATGKSLKEVIAKENKKMTSREALEFGLIDEVILF